MPLANRAPKREFTAGSFLYGFTAGDNFDSRFSALEIINTLFSGQLLTVNSYKFASGETEGVNETTDGYFTFLKENDEIREIRISLVNQTGEDNSQDLLDFLTVEGGVGVLFQDGSGQNKGYFVVENASIMLNYISINVKSTEFISEFDNEEVYKLSLEFITKQNNKIKEADAGTVDSTGNPNTDEDILSKINAIDYSVGEEELQAISIKIWRGAEDKVFLSDVIYIIKPGKGFYGLNGKDLTMDDLFRVYENALSDGNIARLKELIYEESSISLNASPSTFEKNLTNGVDVTFTYTVSENDDVIQSADFDGTDVSSNPDGSQTFTSLKNSLSKIYSAVLLDTNAGENKNLSRTFEAQALTPQFKGSSNSNAGFNGQDYSSLNGALSKILQSSTTTSIIVPANKYGVFLSTKSGADIIEEGTGFALSSGYIETPITVEFQDGTALNLIQYIINKATAEFTYKLE
jgi:hypothetical protein